MNVVKFLLTICLILGVQSGASAQKHESIMHIRAQAPSQEVTLLDLVKSEDYERSYSYNEYGYITSVMVKRKSEGVWGLDTDDSYIQDFTFDANGVCTSRIRYAVDASGQRADVKDKAEVEKIALSDAAAEKWLGGKTPKKIIVVPNKIVNIVI